MENVDYVHLGKRRDETIWGVKVHDAGNYSANVSKSAARIRRRSNRSPKKSIQLSSKKVEYSLRLRHGRSLMPHHEEHG